MRYPMPFTRLEIAVLGIVEGSLHVLLARRAEAPFKGKWGLPGGALRIDLDTSLDEAARRVMRERLGLELPFLKQIGASGGPTRDPRFPWALSVVYRALVPSESLHPVPGKRIDALHWHSVDAVAADNALAFDHGLLVAQAVSITRAEVKRLYLPFGLLPARFTLGELQSTCEQLLGAPLDKSSFRKRLADRDLLEAVKGEMRGGAFRPAQLYRRKAKADAG
jgi:ADP-ribose pyrophosphatase YjhB (NUDIX family)